jgi:bifunctional UDP-N-acetylglucosamine pyrophosphorylase/glucosamine-1-phosphate N-acetyltransferase
MNDDPQRMLRRAALAVGVTMIAPETVFLSDDTVFGKRVTIEPFVVFGPGVTVADGATIHAFTYLSGAEIGADASVGPYARLRPGSKIGAGAKIGNFVEIKAAAIGAGAKVNHLSYVGDADVGEKANVGAGAITCNYDGVEKNRTSIGSGAFVGTNVSLVAPVSVGDRAYVGSGSVITRDVPDDAMAVERGQQTNSEGGATRYRESRGARRQVKGRSAAGFAKLST